MKRTIFRRITAFALILTLMVSALPGMNLTALAADQKPMLVVDMLDRSIGPIIHGSAGFLYGVSSEDVPTTSLITPLKPKVLATKGALGTEHPYGDALDVAKTFLESGGQQVQMYNSNYYAIFGPTCTSAQYAVVLETVIAPAVAEWKRLWKIDHNTDPVTGIDDLGLDIDKAIVYIPINEGTPNSGAGGFVNSWKMFYDAIKASDPKAAICGPNDSGYGHQVNMRTFLTFCQTNNCLPDYVTWHQLDNSESRFAAYPGEFASYKQICRDLGIEELPVVINEYAAMVDCGVPGRLINFFANFEENRVYACLPFWHQANNLNDTAADANEPNSAWWLYKWYGDMTGDLLKNQRLNTTLTGLNGVSAIDDNKQVVHTLFGGIDGSSVVILKDLDKTELFRDATKVNVKIEATFFKGFNSMTEPETLIEGTYALEDGNLVIETDNMKFSTGYFVTVTPAKAEDTVGNPLTGAFHGVYEAEDAARVGGVGTVTDGKYYLSASQAIYNFSTTAGIDYSVTVPVDGRYKLEFVYGNQVGLNRGNESLHKPLNQTQQLSVDDGAYREIILKNTMERAWTAIYTEYIDLTAGTHTVSIRGSGSSNSNILQDALHVTYAGAHQQPLPVFDKIYEAESADFNELHKVSQTAVSTATAIGGYTGSGYVTGLNVNPATIGGGVRWTVVVQESGLYNVSLRYQSAAAGQANIYIGNTARTFDGFKKSVDIVNTGGEWALAKATIYLQKGCNIVDIDTSADIALDHMRVRKAAGAESLSQTVKAVDAIPSGAQVTDVPYLVWDCRNTGTTSAPVPELFSTTLTTPKITTTSLTPDGVNVEYVVGRSLTGDPDAENDVDKYLEFEVTAPAAGTYAMQVFQSGDEIFGTHSYNTKIIDKFACIKVNDHPSKRYFFINTISRDTFKEKSVYIELEAGVNTIKVFNDDSWTNLKGLENSSGAYGAGHSSRGFSNNYYMDKPGNIPIVNSLPNLLKFVITPAALATPLADPVVEHRVNIRATSGGTAVADKNAVADGEDVKITITAKTALTDVLVNGVSKKDALVEKGTGVYELTITNVKEDLDIQALFVAETTDNENDPDSLISNNSFGTGDLTGWKLNTTGQGNVETDIFERYDGKHYLKLSGGADYSATLSQSVTVPEGGVYSLGFAMKNMGVSSAVMGNYNTIEFTASVNGKTYIYKPLTAAETYERIEGTVTVPEGGATVDFSVTINAKAGFDVYLDSFTLTLPPPRAVLLSESDLQSAFGNGGEYIIGADFSVINAGIITTKQGHIDGDGKMMIRGNGKFGDAMIYSNNSTNWTFENMTIDGNKAAGYTHADACIWMGSGKVTFKDVTIQNFKGSNTNRLPITNAGCEVILDGAVFKNNENASPYFPGDSGINTTGGTTRLKGATKVNILYRGGTIDVSGLTRGCGVVIHADTDARYNTIKGLTCADSSVTKFTDDAQRMVYFGIDSWSMDVSKTTSEDEVIINVLLKNRDSDINDVSVGVAVYDNADNLMSEKNQDVTLEEGTQTSLAFSFGDLDKISMIRVSLMDKNTKEPIVPSVVLFSSIAEEMMRALKASLAEAKIIDASYWPAIEKGILEKTIAFAQSVVDSGTDDSVLISNAYEAIQYALSLTPEVFQPVVAVDMPCSKIVAGYAANLPVDVTFDGESAEIAVGFYKPDGSLLESLNVSENGRHTFKLKPEDAVPGNYLVKAMRGDSVLAQKVVECVAQPENLWEPAVTTEPGATKITFASDVSFNAAKKKVTIGGETITNSNVSESGKVITIGKEAASGQQIVISGVKYADLFPSYSFTFTLDYQG